MPKPLDLARIRRALNRLDELAAAHPELTQGEGGRWADNLDELERTLDADRPGQVPPDDETVKPMAKDEKTRQMEWRQRMAEAGFREYRAWLPPETAERLEAVLEARGYGPGTRRDGLCAIITEAVDRLADREAAHKGNG